MPLQKKMSYEASPGELYKGITSISMPFEGETKAGVEKNPEFVIFCKRMSKQFPAFGRDTVFTQEQNEAIQFLGWRLSPQELNAAMMGVMIFGSILAVVVTVIVTFVGLSIDLGFTSLGLGLFTDMFGDLAIMIVVAVAAILFGIVAMIAFMIKSYPINSADDERNKALTYVPEMVGYMIMSMKLVPNLEKAIEFSSKHGKGKVADDFNRLIWDFQMGNFSSIAEGLDLMATRWGKYSSELKGALMKMRASVMEPSEARRYQILDKTMLDVLESVKDKMGDYARSLNQPAVMLFYIGILLPLLLVIILPVGSAFSNMPFATAPVLVFIYCFLIPFMAFTFAKNVVKKRPPTYEPPKIDDNFAELPPKWSMQLSGKTLDVRMLAIVIVIVGLCGSIFLSMEGLPPKFLFPVDEEGLSMIPFQLIPADKSLLEVNKEKGGVNYFEKITVDLYGIQLGEGFGGGIKEGDRFLQLTAEGMTEDEALAEVIKERIEFTSSAAHDPTKYIFWSGIILTIVGAFSFIVFYRNIYKRVAQVKIIQMEDEFKESMYMIASRMGENKPVENALKQAKDFLPNLMISERVFGKTVENIELMGLPLESAVFDPIYGSMRGIPSKILETAMRLLVDSVNLGVEVASRTLMSLSLQMENMDKVNKSLKELVSDVTTTMQTMAVFIAPMVLGITTALQKVVLMTLAQVVSNPQVTEADSVTSSITSQLGDLGGMNMNNMFSVNITSFQTLATPLEYLFIIGTYVALIVIILTYFTVRIKEDNDLVFKITLAKTLPVAMLIYLVTTIVANFAVTSMMVTG
ncbi:MAG: hypothetical protein NTY48_00860 [Candidatus Diapherotrites archaeon]|nr:hypothetical protein [Candidatus Diapherotrites archaeon]